MSEDNIIEIYLNTNFWYFECRVCQIRSGAFSFFTDLIIHLGYHSFNDDHVEAMKIVRNDK